MKTLILSLSAFVCSLLCFGQEQEDTSKFLLQTDPDLWGKEIFKLPTGFAREMTLTGFEDASFPKGWIDSNSDNFWTYVFAWSVDKETLVSGQELEDNLMLYFNGLVDAKQDTIINGRLPSSVLLVNTTKTQETSTFTGKVRIFDRFTTQKMLTLNLLVEQQICPETKKALIVFRFSPKALEHKVWTMLTAVPLLEDACDKE